MSNEQRLRIWRALSDLFLDTEIEDLSFAYIARTVSESGFSLDEVEDILWYEVYPVLESNLRSTAGVWDGWRDSWLLENLPPAARSKTVQGQASIIKDIKQYWLKVTEEYEMESR